MEQSNSNDCYEFDAPSHFIDFKTVDKTADNADNWFEAQIGESNLTTPHRNNKPLGGTQKANLPRAIVSPCRKEDHEPAASSPPSNIVTSWGNRGPAQMGARPKRNTTTQPPAQPRRVSKRKTTNGEPSTGSHPQVAPPVKKSRGGTTPRPARRSNGSLRRSVQKARAAAAAATSTTQHKSSEEQELERIRALQKEVAEHRKKNEASYKAAMAGGPLPKKLTLSTTVPKEFNFSTDARAKTGPAASDPSYKEVDFRTQLRKHASPAKAPKGSTVPKPFNLSTGNKRKVDEQSSYVSVAQQIEQFHRRTPDRYHLRSRQSQDRGPSPVKGDHLKITQPHTPQLMTKQRTRSTLVKSSAEIEAEELDKLQKFKFKALELNRKILESALNPKKPAAKESTKTEAFQLQIEKRLQERQAAKKPEEAEKPTFHSQPIPTKILEGVVGVPVKKAFHPTVPESPAFALKNRVRVDRKVEEVKLPSPIKAQPVPHFGLPFQPRLQEKTQVEVCPFSFDERERERRALKEKRLEEMRNEEVPKFKAQPLPDFQEVVGLPEKKVMEPTKPEPFKMLIDQRGAVKNDRWEQMMKGEQKRQAEAASFKAGPNTVIHKEPFLPKKENRSVPEGINRSVVPEAFQLSTERRAKERQEYERAVSETQALRAHLQEEQHRQQEREEEEEIARLRHDQVHKAQPVRHYKPVEVKKSDLALTVPHSPNFSKRFHL